MVLVHLKKPNGNMESRMIPLRVFKAIATRLAKKRSKKQTKVILGSRILKIGSSEAIPSIQKMQP